MADPMVDMEAMATERGSNNSELPGCRKADVSCGQCLEAERLSCSTLTYLNQENYQVDIKFKDMENSYIIKEKVINKPKLLKVGVAQVVKEVFQFQIPYWLPNPIILLDPIPFLGLDLIDPRSSSILCLTLL